MHVFTRPWSTACVNSEVVRVSISSLFALGAATICEATTTATIMAKTTQTMVVVRLLAGLGFLLLPWLLPFWLPLPLPP